MNCYRCRQQQEANCSKSAGHGFKFARQAHWLRLEPSKHCINPSWTMGAVVQGVRHGHERCDGDNHRRQAKDEQPASH